MTLALVNAILDERGNYNEDLVIQAYEGWANSKGFGLDKNTRRLFHGVKTVNGYRKRYQQALQEDLSTTQS